MWLTLSRLRDLQHRAPPLDEEVSLVSEGDRLVGVLAGADMVAQVVVGCAEPGCRVKGAETMYRIGALLDAAMGMRRWTGQ